MKIGYLLFIIFGFVSIGCSTNLTELYYRENIDASLLISVEKNIQKPLMVETNDFTTAYNQLLTEGYILLGISVFKNTLDDEFNAFQLAREKGAGLVLRTTKFSHSEYNNFYIPLTTNSVTNTSMNGSFSSRIYDNGYSYLGKVNTGFSGDAQSTTTSTQWVPVQYREDIYLQGFAFFVKNNSKYTFGAYYRDLNSDEQKRFSRNKGVVVTNVIKNSPAFNMNIFPGDVLLEYNEQVVIDANSFNRVLQKGNEPSRLSIIRDNNIIILDSDISNDRIIANDKVN